MFNFDLHEHWAKAQNAGKLGRHCITASHSNARMRQAEDVSPALTICAHKSGPGGSFIMPSFTAIPTLALSDARDPATKPAFLESLRNALLNVGFLYLSDTSLPQTLIDDVIRECRAFFEELPEEEKLKVEMKNESSFLGYSRLGNEMTAGAADWREQMDLVSRDTVKTSSGMRGWTDDLGCRLCRADAAIRDDESGVCQSGIGPIEDAVAPEDLGSARFCGTKTHGSSFLDTGVGQHSRAHSGSKDVSPWFCRRLLTSSVYRARRMPFLALLLLHGISSGGQINGLRKMHCRSSDRHTKSICG